MLPGDFLLETVRGNHRRNRPTPFTVKWDSNRIDRDTEICAEDEEFHVHHRQIQFDVCLHCVPVDTFCKITGKHALTALSCNLCDLCHFFSRSIGEPSQNFLFVIPASMELGEAELRFVREAVNRILHDTHAGDDLAFRRTDGHIRGTFVELVEASIFSPFTQVFFVEPVAFSILLKHKCSATLDRLLVVSNRESDRGNAPYCPKFTKRCLHD